MKKHPNPKLLFIERMKLLLGKDFENYEKILEEGPVKSIRANTLKISPEKLKKRLEKNYNWKIKQPWKNYPEVMIVEGKLPAHIHSQMDKRVNNKTIPKKDLSVNNNLAESRAERRLGANQSASPNDFVVASNFPIQSRVRGREVDSKPILIDLEPGELGRSLEHLLGYYYIQELASMLPVIALKPEKENLILDLCSAPGSKTTQIATEMKNTGTIIANDVSLGRIKILAANLERCGVTNTIITRKEGSALCKRIKKYMPNFKFDKILIDAPCSGEGTLRSSPATYLMWNIKTIKRLSRLQKKLIESSFEILKVGGEIVYSTCTHAPEENEEIVDFALKKFGDKIKIEEIKLPVKCRPGIQEWGSNIRRENKNLSSGGREFREARGETVRTREQIKKFSSELKKSCRIYPQDNNTEGFFVAKLKRVK